MSITTDNTPTKKAKYIKIYDKLCSMILSGVYPEGSQLPGEIELSETLKVSRMTLRKALSLLLEEGLIVSKLGIGHFVCKNNKKTLKENLNKLSSPMYKCCDISLDNIEIDFLIEVPSNEINEELDRRVSAVVVSKRIYKNKNIVIGYVKTYLPIEVVSLVSLDLNDKESLLTFLDKEIYKLCSNAKYSLSFSNVCEFDENNSYNYVLLKEHIYSDNNNLLTVSSYYVRADHFCANFYASK